jgi:hypothetical protein
MERELHLGAEGLVRAQGVARDAVDVAAGALERGVAVAEVRALLRAAGRVVFGIEVEDELLAAGAGGLKDVPPVEGRLKSGTALPSISRGFYNPS